MRLSIFSCFSGFRSFHDVGVDKRRFSFFDTAIAGRSHLLVMLD